MFSCDYNGWADVREEEREAIEVFESAGSMPLTPLFVQVGSYMITPEGARSGATRPAGSPSKLSGSHTSLAA